MKAILKKMMIMLYRCMAHILPVNSRKAVFMSNMGKCCAGSPKAVYEEMKKRGDYADICAVWAFTKAYLDTPGRLLPTGCKVVRYGGPAYYFHMATAGLWIFDTRQEDYLVKRKKCIYLQTWHGTPLKKLGLDIEHVKMAGEKAGSNYASAIMRESRKWDLLIAQNPFSVEIFRRCFAYSGEILESGYPRNDCLKKLSSGAANRQNGTGSGSRIQAPAGENDTGSRIQTPADADGNRSRIQTPADADGTRRKILYAPTWRDDEYGADGWYRFSSQLDFEKMESALGERFTLVVKPHYLVKMQTGDIPEGCIGRGFVEVCGNETDISELYLTADILITDYSSVMFDFAITKKPMLFFVPDMERYRDELRGFYFDLLAEAPGPLCATTAEVINAIETIDRTGGTASETADLYRKFSGKYNTFEEGNSSAKVLDRLAELMHRAGRA